MRSYQIKTYDATSTFCISVSVSADGCPEHQARMHGATHPITKCNTFFCRITTALVAHPNIQVTWWSCHPSQTGWLREDRHAKTVSIPGKSNLWVSSGHKMDRVHAGSWAIGSYQAPTPTQVSRYVLTEPAQSQAQCPLTKSNVERLQSIDWTRTDFAISIRRGNPILQALLSGEKPSHQVCLSTVVYYLNLDQSNKSTKI